MRTLFESRTATSAHRRRIPGGSFGLWTCFALVVGMIATLSLAGCSGEDPFDTGPTRSAAPNALGVTTDTVESAGAPVASQASEEPQRKKAEAGVTGRGDYGGGMGTASLSAYVRVQEKVEFQQVEYALKLYKAQHGEFPKSHEEFEEKIIKPNNIKLPDLQPGDEYIFDPEKGELMVETTKKK